MKNDPRLTIEIDQTISRLGPDEDIETNGSINFSQLTNGAVVSNLTNMLNGLLITTLGYRHGNVSQLFKNLPAKFGRSKDLAYIVTKIGRVVTQPHLPSIKIFSDMRKEPVNEIPILQHRIRVINLIIEILNSNRNVYLKLALFNLIRNAGEYKVTSMFLHGQQNCMLVYSVKPSETTFEDLIKDTNILELLRKDSYMSGIMSKFKVVGPEIEKLYPEAYKAAGTAINKILNAESISEVLIPYQVFLEELIEHLGKPTNDPTFERVFNLDCGCEHRPLQARDLVIGEIIFHLYKLKSE